MSIVIDILELDEPYLEFGPGNENIDPKVGLREAGPLSLRFGPAHREHVRVGLVGPQAMLDHARLWFARCQGYMSSGSTSHALHADFPGFRQVFRASLDLSPQLWDFRIPDDEIEKALARPTPQERFNTMLNLYAAGICRSRGGELQSDVVVVCLSNEIIQNCRSVKALRLTRQEKKILKSQQLGQLALPGMEEMMTIEDTLLYRNFRRALKARAMDIGVPIQIGTDNLFLDSEDNQDPATRAWNVSLALFYKAGGLPWRLASLAPETCYVGISFHHLRTQQRHLVFSSLAQAFPTTGEGFALRGDAIPWGRDSEDRTPHLTEEQAAGLALRVLDQYRQRLGNNPLRVVLYKTSKFSDAEQSGFRAALSHIPVVEMVNLRPSEFRLVRRGAYPPRRGTIAIVNDHTYYLFTNGFFSYWGTYMGAHIPVPYEVTVLGDADPLQVCTDVLGLTKLNWNTARAFTSSPIPMRFACEVGSIMSHYAELKGEDAEPEPSYRFYM
jgi:hypothetical protein